MEYFSGNKSIASLRVVSGAIRLVKRLLRVGQWGPARAPLALGHIDFAHASVYNRTVPLTTRKVWSTQRTASFISVYYDTLVRRRLW